MHRSLLTLPLTLATVSLVAVTAAATAPVLESLLKEREHEELGEAVAEYWQATNEGEGIQEAFAEVQEAVTKQAGKLKDRLPDGDLLAAVEDWETIFFLATEIDDRAAKKGKVENRRYEDPVLGEYKMAISTPKKYSPKAGPVPLVICIPPKGKQAEAHLIEDWTDLEKRETYVLAACDMPTNERMWASLGTAENHGGIDTVLLTLRSVKTSHAVDVDRVFLAGFGEGVEAALHIASLYPNVFAGVVGRAGDPGDQDPTNLRCLPTFFAGAGEKATAFQAAAKELGIENVTLNTAGTEADAWAWIDAQTRISNPLDVSLAPQEDFNNQAYWLKAEGFDVAASPKVRARVDRETNTITIESEGVTSAILYFNDLLVDLSKPVKVICNGAESLDEIPRNLKTMLDLAYYRGDSGLVYVNAHTYDLPVPK